MGTCVSKLERPKNISGKIKGRKKEKKKKKSKKCGIKKDKIRAVINPNCNKT